MARSATVTFPTQRVGQNFNGKIVLLFSLTFISLQTGESWNNYHNDFNTSSNSHPLCFAPFWSKLEIVCGQQLPIFSKQGISSVFLWSDIFSNTDQFVAGPSIGNWIIFSATSFCKLCCSFVTILSALGCLRKWESKYELLPYTLSHPRILYEHLTVHFLICGSYSHQIRERTQVHLLIPFLKLL